MVSLGFDADGKRIRKKVSGKTRTEVKDKLKALHAELDAGLRTAQGYTVEKAVADWLDESLPGRTAKTVEANRDSLRPLLAVIGRIPHGLQPSVGLDFGVAALERAHGRARNGSVPP